MIENRIATILRTHRIPQAAVADFADVSTFKLSLSLRGIAELPHTAQTRVESVTEAMVALIDESPVPISWRERSRLKALVQGKAAELRAAATA